MKVRDVMTREVLVAAPNDTIREVAREMARIDAGVLPVRENEQLVGMITDRDITIRAVGADLDPSTTTVRQVMTADVRFCYDDENVEEVARDMARLQLRRMPVVDRHRRLVGIVSIGDLAQDMKPSRVGATLREVSEPGGRYSQAVPEGGDRQPGERHS